MKSSARTRSLTSRAACSSSWMSLSIWRGAFGRCTLTATCWPFGSTARCTWPIEAAAIGFSSNSRKSRSIGCFSSSAITRSTSANGNGAHVVLEAAQLGDDVGRDDVRARREQLPELDERRPELVEHLAQVSPADRVDASGRRAGDPRAATRSRASPRPGRSRPAGRCSPSSTSTPSGASVAAAVRQRGNAAGTPPSTGIDRTGRRARAVGDEERDRLGDVGAGDRRGRAGCARRRSVSSSSTATPCASARSRRSSSDQSFEPAKIASGLTAFARMPAGRPRARRSASAGRARPSRPSTGRSRRRARRRSSRRRRRGCRRCPARAAAPSTRLVSRKCAVRLTSRLRRHSLLGERLERPGRGDAGVEDDRVERRRSSPTAAWTSSSTTARVGQVAGDRDRAVEALGGLGEAVGVEVGEHEVRAARGEVAGDRRGRCRTRRR